MKRILRYFKGLEGQTIMAPLFKLLEACFELLVPLVVANIIDKQIPSGSSQKIVLLALLLIGMGICGLASSFVAQYFSAKVAMCVCERMKNDLYQHITTLSYSQIDKLGINTIETRMTSDMNQVQTGVNLTLRLLLRSPFIVFGAMIVAFTIDTRMALIFLGIIIIELIIVALIMGRTIPLHKKTQNKLDKVLSSARENLTGVRVIRAFAQEDVEEKEFVSRNEDLKSNQLKAGYISALLNPLTYVLINLTLVFLVYRGALRVDAGTLTAGKVIALYNLLSQILIELIKLANLIITMTRMVACANRVEDCFNMTCDEEEGTLALNPSGNALALDFKNVTLIYKTSHEPVLKNIEFSLKGGETLGLIGGTGSGKSSLISLIPRLYEASDGEVLIDNHNVNEYIKSDLKRAISVVFQKALLFKGTIRSNLLLGCPEASESDMFEALKIAQAYDFVMEKEGLDTPVSEGGQNFSGGQRQRLCIARALVRKPRLLILDDSASALDLMTEKALREALNHLSFETTLIIVSQRTSSIKQADKIIVLDEGIIKGIGTHQELLKTCSLYKEIHLSQFPEEVAHETH